MKIVDYPVKKDYSETFEEVRSFIESTIERGIQFNFHWSRWEWFFARGSFSAERLSEIKLFYKANKLVGILLFEDNENTYFYIAENDFELKNLIFTTFSNLYSSSNLIIEDSDLMMQEIASENSMYCTKYHEDMAIYVGNATELNKHTDYVITSLEDEYNMEEYNYCLHRGFNHGDNVSFGDVEFKSRTRQTSSPNFNRHLALAMKHKEHFVSYINIYYRENTKYALVEPVATVPDHRKKGLGKLLIYEGIKRAKKLGAKHILVGSNQEFYYKIGFAPLVSSSVWTMK